MNRAEAERLLGGYATGTLTEAERAELFAAALHHQALFDALADEEALRELLADPAARAQVLAALAAPAQVIPLWRRNGVLGAAAGLIMAATAGLAYLRHPPALPRPALAAKVQAEAPAAPTPQASAPPAAKLVPEAPTRRAKATEELVPVLQEAVASRAAQGQAAAVADAAPAQPGAAAKSLEYRRSEARDQLASKREVAAPAPAALLGAVGGVAPAPSAARAKADKRNQEGPAEVAAQGTLPTPTPTWTLVPEADGRTRVTVTVVPGAWPYLLKRTAEGVVVVDLEPGPVLPGARTWQGRLALEPGATLDLFVLAAEAAHPAELPETGPAPGFRARLHPALKKVTPP